MPPTTSEITAIDEISNAMVPVVFSTIFLMLSLFCVKKSSVPCRARNSSVMPFSAVCVSTSGLTFTVILLMYLLPLIWLISVV